MVKEPPNNGRQKINNPNDHSRYDTVPDKSPRDAQGGRKHTSQKDKKLPMEQGRDPLLRPIWRKPIKWRSRWTLAQCSRSLEHWQSGAPEVRSTGGPKLQQFWSSREKL